MKNVLGARPSPIAGQWYSANARRLAAEVDRYLDAAELPPLNGEVVAVVAPHAGHLYSGPVAGYAFAALRGLAPEVVVIVSPMHYPYAAPVLTTAHSAYQTPLGDVPVLQAAVEDLDRLLEQEVGYGLQPVANDPEHSLEIELPFLQRTLAGPFALVPVMLRDQSQTAAHGLGQALARLTRESPALAGKTVILVASTDLSHFYSQPEAKALDSVMLQRIEAFDPAGIIRADELGQGFACGRGALAAILWAARELGADQARVVRHATSGDITGDYDRVVGYGAAVITRNRN